ncbi:hypothetical protein FDF74_12365 [Clostridium niameyense]|uniref:HTH cro/C1-type domain-containing protein n=1 Tax=Clostridium niameyense TaxID=1622073 RepID=A0A6M0RCI3_9CLOT|nr:hypothetical protein [Clostridium niameyense]NEZ47976.1 hypothetical protein [Clostridium niameyense]
MGKIDNKTEIKNRIKKNKELLEELKKEYLLCCKPQGYPKATSYVDADNIHAGRKEYNIIEFVDRVRVLEHLIYIDLEILKNFEKDERINNKLRNLKTLEDKIYYLRKVEGLKQDTVAKMLYISTRHLQRIEKNLNKKLSC